MFKSVLFVLACLVALFYFFGAAILAFVSPLAAAALVFLGGAFIFGTASFWLLVAVVTLFAAWCVSEDYDAGDDEKPWSLTAVATVILFGGFMAFANANLFSFESYSGWVIAGGVVLAFASYLALGAGWSWFKYSRFLNKRFSKLESWKSSWLQSNSDIFKNEVEVAEAIKAKAPDKVDDNYYEQRTKQSKAVNYKSHVESVLYSLKPSQNMNRILVWIGLWPWVMVADILRDPVKMVYEMMLGFYNSLYEKTVGQSEKQFQAVFSDNSTE